MRNLIKFPVHNKMYVCADIIYVAGVTAFDLRPHLFVSHSMSVVALAATSMNAKHIEMKIVPMSAVLRRVEMCK